MKDFNKVIIIGGAGFIGGKLVRKLSVNKDLKITVIYVGRLKETEKVIGVNYKKIDLSQNGKEAAEIIKQTNYAILMAQPNESIVINFLKYTKNSNLKKIIYTSTLLLYPDSSKKHDESVKPDPLTEYETKKYNEEKILKKFANVENKVCIARLGNVYGDVKNGGIISYIMKSLKDDQIFSINGDGGHIRDYIFVDDVVNALEKLIFNEQVDDWQIYNVCTGVGHTINELVLELEKIAGKKITIKNKKPIVEKISVVGNNQKIKTAVKFETKFNFIQGLSQTYKNYLI